MFNVHVYVIIRKKKKKKILWYLTNFTNKSRVDTQYLLNKQPFIPLVLHIRKYTEKYFIQMFFLSDPQI